MQEKAAAQMWLKVPLSLPPCAFVYIGLLMLLSVGVIFACSDRSWALLLVLVEPYHDNQNVKDYFDTITKKMQRFTSEHFQKRAEIALHCLTFFALMPDPLSPSTSRPYFYNRSLPEHVQDLVYLTLEPLFSTPDYLPLIPPT